MSRPSILPLPDAQAALLVRALQPILDAHPIGRDHRDFVHEFIRAVHAATGRTFSPPIYRKLLNAYAPGRNPSTDTLAQEKRALDATLDQEADAGRQLDAYSGDQLAAVISRAVDTAVARQARPTAPVAVQRDRYGDAQVDFLQARLAETERMLADVRAQAARCAGELQAAQAVRITLQAQLDANHMRAQEQSTHLEKLTNELASMRKFALMAIDTARGETRAQQERAAHLESLLKTEKMHTEVFRRLAYRNGAPIPDVLRPEDKK